MTKIGLLGDVHGSADWLQYALDKFRREDIRTVIQLGDFGIFSGGYGGVFLSRARQYADANKQQLLVVPGNHDDYDFIERLPLEHSGWLKLSANVKVALRGLRFIVGGRTFLAMSGAASVDRTWRQMQNQRTSGVFKIWWEQEFITPAQAEEMKTLGHADVIVGHDSPMTAELKAELDAQGLVWDPNDLEYAARHQAVVADIVDAVRPQLLFHGHYHFRVEGWWNETRVVGLSKDFAEDSLAWLDTDTLEYGFYPLKDDFRDRSSSGLFNTV